MRPRIILCFTAVACCLTATVAAAQRGTPTSPAGRPVVSSTRPGSEAQDASGRLRAEVDALTQLVTALSARVDSLQQANVHLRTELQQTHTELMQAQASTNGQLQALRAEYQQHTHRFPSVSLVGPGLWPDGARPNLSGSGKFVVISFPSSTSHIDLGGPVPQN
jgi:uncharacterized protein YlxW (UPF0749 family)